MSSSKIHRVELQDFKSYFGRVSIGPFHDFTCIVGPNGGGKSNLMDALSIVFSATPDARGVPVKEFINRKSNNGSCSVTVVMRSTRSTSSAPSSSREMREGPYSETTFTRQIRAQGDSIFLVDGKVVGEADYFKLLKEHNISTRVQNFIVFQHQVDAVTQKTPAELTAFIEEVGGGSSLKDAYGSKKKELDMAKEHLAQASVEKRGAAIEINQMRIVQKDAEEFRQIKQQYEQERLNLSLVELFHIETMLHRQKEELTRFYTTLDGLQKSIPSESAIRQMKQEYIHQHKEYMEELQRSRTVGEELRTKLSLLERTKASVEYISRQQEAQKREMEFLKKTMSSRSVELKRLQSQKERYEGLLKSFDIETESETAMAANAAGNLSKEDMQEYSRLKAEVECQTVTKRQQRETLDRQLQATNAALDQCSAAREHVQLRRKEVCSAIEQLQSHRTSLEQRKADLTSGIVALEKQIRVAQKEQVESKKRHSEREANLFKIQEQLRELRHVKDTDKQNNRTADVIQTLKSLYPVEGRLVDVCTIPNDMYRNALTVALGKNLDALIVDTTETAIRCVEYLKQQRLPSMTFLPLDTVSGKAVTDRLRTFGGSCKPMVDVIQYASAIEPVIRYALGETMVCDTIKEAKQVAYHNPTGERFKVVTLDGTVLMKNGIIQGGLASIEGRARKWDDKKYEELRATRDRLLQETVRSGEAEMARAQVELRDMMSRLSFSRERLNVVEGEVTTNQRKIQEAEAEQTKCAEAEEDLQQKEARYQSEKQGLLAAIAEMNASISNVEQEMFRDLQKRVDIKALLELERHQQEVAQDRGQRRQQLVVVIHKLQSAMEVEEKRMGLQSIKEAQTIFDKKEKELEVSMKNAKVLEDECQRVRQRSTNVKKKLLGLREALDKLQERIRQSIRSSETDLHRLALARKGGAGLEAACDGLRQRRLAVIRRCQMDGMELPLKPFDSTSSSSTDACLSSTAPPPPSAGTKRQRDGEARRARMTAISSATSSSSTLHSEAFVLRAMGEEKEDDGAAPGNRPASSAPQSPPHDTASSVMIDFTGMSDELRAAAETRERLAAFQQQSESRISTWQAKMEVLGPQLKAAARLSTSAEDLLDKSSVELEQARDRVRKANAEFQEVRRRRTAMFMEVFDALASHVDRIYKELTAGTRSHGAPGSAYLSLEDTSEPYLGGTAYHVTPPLKRFMPMELLSGGERTMAALAFLFSIHAIQPSPFFILDEVDAALDAGNVDKLARYVRHKAQECQFVVVSHKDHLFSLADVLFGVTGEKKDASRILSLDMRGYTF